jgi:endonuclease YncB( thermonuclease family)
VIDGDSLEIEGKRVRISGIDAPEIAQTCTAADGTPFACGRRARAELERLAGGHELECRREGRDRFERVLASCRSGGADIAAAMVASGWALAFSGPAGDRLRGAERRAREARAGMWAGGFERPEEWRRRAGR